MLYTESWKQYSHEDITSHTKNTFFLTSHGAMLAILTGISSVLIKMEPLLLNNFKLYLGLILLGVFSSIIGMIGLIINRYWKQVNDVHRAMINVRWLTARAVEVELDLHTIGVASLEHEWRKHIKISNDKYYPFTNHSKLSEHNISSTFTIGGFDSIHGVIKSISFLWAIVVFCGINILSVSIWIALYSY